VGLSIMQRVTVPILCGKSTRWRTVGSLGLPPGGVTILCGKSTGGIPILRGRSNGWHYAG